MEVIRVGALVEVWLGYPDKSDSDFIASFHSDYCPQLIAALKKFEQREGR
tara:strand:+ start:276 stop:425 length:150 start_codon:yes stop_codon:yes gene_type:complete